MNAPRLEPATDGRRPLNVLFTVDTEVWPETADWRADNLLRDVDRDLNGKTSEGEFGTAYQAQTLASHDLKGVFFVEALYAYAVGLEFLKKTINAIAGCGHEVGLHTHPEWLKRIGSLLPGR